MPARDSIHPLVKQALIKDGWQITDDPFVITYGERFLFVDLGATDNTNKNNPQGTFLGAEREGVKIAIEIKEFGGKSAITDLEQAIGQYTLYCLLLNRIEPERKLYLAITDFTYNDIFSEPIGELVIQDLPLNLLIIDIVKTEVSLWIPSKPILT
jgi:hypothetical protein